jgi:hypothetical protein
MARADLMKSLPLSAKRFGIEPELTARLAQSGARIYEVPISYSGRTYAEGKKIGWKDGAAALWHIVRSNLLGPRAPRYSTGQGTGIPVPLPPRRKTDRVEPPHAHGFVTTSSRGI